MFEGFKELDIEVADTSIHGRRGGVGPPVLLLHGFPETHVMWHAVAPRLAEQFTVVATDLRGYGDSGAPESDPDHTPYSMRTLARDQVDAMHALGYQTFAVVGHDRGARCAYRMALDHPTSIDRVGVLDIVPTGHAFNHAGKELALGYWVWSFLAAPFPIPETLIASAPRFFVDHVLDGWSADPTCFEDEVRRIYARQLADPVRLHAICEQYRAAATSDVADDDADLGRVTITAPLLALWSAEGPVDSWYQPLDVWRSWADDVRGRALGGGHFMPEEAPEEILRELKQVLDASHFAA
jgi:haloacetate dehalogenase